MIALLAPGQGSQTPGMLTSWLEMPGAADRLALWSKASQLDLTRLGTTATAEEITDTAVTQPLVVAAALLAFEEIGNRGELPPGIIAAGHSVGELAAAAVAGVISSDEAVMLAAIRGAAMAKACALEPTGMSAVLGGDEDAVLERLAELGLEAANRNAAGQIVAAGLLSALAELAANPPEKARIRALPVAGAFHTRFMAPAQDAVATAAAALSPSDPVTTLLSNSDGKPVLSGADALDKLAAQVTRPVRWDLCTAALREAEVSALVELPPAGTLVGIAKREMRGTPARALKTPEDISGLAELTELGLNQDRGDDAARSTLYIAASHESEGSHSVAATQEELIAGLAEIIEEVTGIEPSEVTIEKSFVDDLDIDSLSMVEIAVQTEDKYGVKIPDEDLASLRTVGDAVSYIQKLEAENPDAAQAIKAKIEGE